MRSLPASSALNIGDPIAKTRAPGPSRSRTCSASALLDVTIWFDAAGMPSCVNRAAYSARELRGSFVRNTICTPDLRRAAIALTDPGTGAGPTHTTPSRSTMSPSKGGFDRVRELSQVFRRIDGLLGRSGTGHRWLTGCDRSMDSGRQVLLRYDQRPSAGANAGA